MVSEVYDLTREKVYADKDAFISTNLSKFVNEHEDVILVILDGVKKTNPIYECIQTKPDQVWDSGIAEQNLIGLAAGAALAGKRVLTQSYGPFLTLRALEQMYLDIAYNNLPVCMIVTSTGVSAGEGATHHTLMDIAITRCIPGMTIIAPSDSYQMVSVMKEYMSNPRPMYIRCSKANEPLIYRDREEKFEIGKAKKIKEGRDIVIIATGVGVKYALEAAQILEKEGVNIGVIDMFTLKPLDIGCIKNVLKNTNNIITVEDHGCIGGLGTMVEEIIAEEKLICDIRKIGIPDEFAINGNEKQLYEYYKLDTLGIIETCKKMWRDRNGENKAI